MKSWIVVVALVCGCKKDSGPTSTSSLPPVPSPTAPKSTAELDALWAKAPAGAIGGVVISPRAIGMTEHAWHDVHTFLKTLPAFAPAEAEMTKELLKAGLSPDVTFADIGLAPGKGFAMFATNDGADGVWLLSVSDRDKFLDKAKGTKGADGVDHLDDMTCKPIDGWYACASKPAILDTLGKGDLRGKLDAVKARGDIEGVMVTPAKAAGVIQIDRGAIVVRGIVGGVPAMVTSKLGSPVKPHVDLDHASGFAVFNVEPLLTDVPPMPLFKGVTAADLAHSVGGPLTVTIGADMSVDARLPLKDTAPAKTALEHCEEIPIPGAKLDGGTCRVPVPMYGFEVEVSIDGKDLRVTTKGGGGPTGPAPASAVGLELAKGEWQLTFWGHGTLLAPSKFVLPPMMAQMPDEAALAIRVMLMLSEVGVGVNVEGDSVRFLATFRTGWANPDDVVAKIGAVSADDVLNGKAGDRGKAIADAAPNSPFAADYRAGVGGVMIPTAVIGILAAVAIPAFLDYMKKSKKNEAELQLNRIGKSARVYYAENGKFPVGKAASLPAFPTCCGLSSTGGGVNNKCPNDEAAWQKDKVWGALEFAIGEPTVYRYAYSSADGKTFTATATSDLDCDGEFATWQLDGTAANGAPTVMLTKPAPGNY
jgi:type II secretory pathway pseudopilin PulG